MGKPSRLYNGDGSPMQTATETLTFITHREPVKQFAVRVTNSQNQEGTAIAIDTVMATSDHRVPWSYATASGTLEYR